MRILEMTNAERDGGGASPDKIDAAMRAMMDDGVAAFTNAVHPDHVAALRERTWADLDAILARPDAPFNFNTGNVQQDPPPFSPFLFRDVLLNAAAIAVTKRLLGPGVKNGFYSGNTALPGGSRQPVHPDSGQLWPDLTTATPPYGIVVNIPLVDVSPENGSTELWPGTHADTRYSVHDGSIRIPADVLDARRQISPPLQPSLPAGSVVLRDIRLWHAGMPNHTQTPRPMLAMIHWIGWWPTSKIPFPKGTEDFFRHADLTTDAEFVDGEIDYLHHNAAYDLQK